jgi:hypothetical protein
MVQAFRITWEADRMVIAGGWRYVAMIEDAGIENDNGTRLMLVRGSAPEGELAKYRTADLARCDHCGARRRRSRVVIIRNEAGAEKQVGATCLDQYCGAGALDAINRLDRLIQDLAALCESFADDEGGGMGGRRGYNGWDLLDVAHVAIHLALHHGFISKRAADDSMGQKVSTTTGVLFLLNPPNPFAREGWEKDRAALAADNVAMEAAKAALDSLQALGARVMGDDAILTDWEYNCGLVAARGYVDGRTLGTWVAATALHAVRAMEAKAKAATPDLPSRHIGTEGERIPLVLRITRTHAYDSAYGPGLIVAGVVEGTGDAWVWFTKYESAEAAFKRGDLLTYEPVAVMATIKKHAANRKTGTPETHLTRISLPPPPKAKKPRKAKEAAPAPAPEGQLCGTCIPDCGCGTCP